MPEKINLSSVVWHLDTGLRDLRLPSPKRSSGFAQAGGSEPAVPKPTDKAANPIIGAGPVVFDNLCGHALECPRRPRHEGIWRLLGPLL